MDHAKMELVRAHGHSLDVCRECGGVWLDGEEVESLLAAPTPPEGASRSSAWAEADFLTPLIGEALGKILDGV
ncbi:MAG: zf-TFIIB domain-containing protein [Methyloversatilis discipulorum]|uniref:zf-TFIIB domain-containing protein n=1 Tax=Methyloversatilis discipulorum TaxID=1119528 RepID=UPI0034C5F729|nr:zf-TFIIB domain-containing protein [Methyloversatilis discipulorum]